MAGGCCVTPNLAQGVTDGREFLMLPFTVAVEEKGPNTYYNGAQRAPRQERIPPLAGEYPYSITNCARNRRVPSTGSGRRRLRTAQAQDIANPFLSSSVVVSSTHQIHPNIRVDVDQENLPPLFRTQPMLGQNTFHRILITD